ncbi:membrane transporter [Botrytis cinerea]
MGLFTSPTSFRLANLAANNDVGVSSISTRSLTDVAFGTMANDHSSHPALGHLILLVFEAVLEVVCVSLPGYIVARQGMFDADKQKFVANLNVALFTPCLIFTKLASQLTADKLVELAVIPVIFIVQTFVSYLVSIGVGKAFGLGKRPANFVTAMGVFGNSNSLPISLVISLSQTLKGLHWDRIPGDNDDEVGARGILYLLIFQQLGQLDEEEGRYRDEPLLIPGLDGEDDNDDNGESSSNSSNFGGRTPVTHALHDNSDEEEPAKIPGILATPTNGNHLPGDNDDITSFPSIRTPPSEEESEIPDGIRGWVPKAKFHTKRTVAKASHQTYHALPTPAQRILTKVSNSVSKFLNGLWEFMNPPLWAMLLAVIVASIPKLQHLFFAEGSFIANSVTRAVSQSGGVAVPLILVVLGANLARNTLPQHVLDENSEENQIGTKLLIASLISRMLLPTLIMAPLLALTAKYVPVSILDDPIFVIVCFLLTGAPSALQLAQICQINGVYEGVMSKLLFQSYVIWILPSTLILVMCALEVVEWAA